MLPQGFTQLNLAPHWLQQRSGTEASAMRSARRGSSATTGWRPRRSPRPSTRPSPTTPIIWMPASSRRSCRSTAPRSSACATCWPTSPRSIRASRATSRACYTEQAGEIAGDLFVDCSGFSSLLLGKTLGVGFKDCSDVLFCDTALAVQVPYDTPDAPDGIAHHLDRAGGGLDLGHRPADAPRRRLRLFQPPHQRGGGARDAAALHRPAAQGPARRARFRSAPVIARPSGRTIASPSASPRAFSSRSSPPPSC